MINIKFKGECPWECKFGNKVNVNYWLSGSKLLWQVNEKHYKISVLRYYTEVGVFLCVKDALGVQKGHYYVDKTQSDMKAIRLAQYLQENVKDIELKGMN